MAVLQQQNFKIIKGMNQDIDIQTSSPDTAFRLFNIKNQVLDGASSNNLTNEKGNSWIPLRSSSNPNISIDGNIIGVIQCTSNMVVIFTVVNVPNVEVINYIYKVTYNLNPEALQVVQLAGGPFGIPEYRSDGSKTEINGIFSYENSEIQKVYWVDGVNQLRYINIVQAGNVIITNPEQLNSCPTFSLDHTLSVQRQSGGGIYSPGTIQYAFTYFNKYGAETNIVDYTPLYYIGEEHRGCMEDETVGCSYKISIANPDSSFDYLRVYSIQRTSLNGTPIVKIVGDVKVKGVQQNTSVYVLDTNGGIAIDSTSLLFKSSSDNIYQYLEQKDGTLFLGNYKSTDTTRNLHSVVQDLLEGNHITFAEQDKNIGITITNNEQYAYLPNLIQNSQQKKLFKKGEIYELGLVFIFKSGKWSTVHHVYTWNPSTNPALVNANQYTKPTLVCSIDNTAATQLASQDIIGVIPVYAVKISHNVKCQGYLSTTMHSSRREDEENIKAQYSWFYRPFMPAQNQKLPYQDEIKMEFQNIWADSKNVYGGDNIWDFNYNIFTINTPEVEVDEMLSDSQLVGCTCSDIGIFKGFTYINNLTITVSGKYLLSYPSTSRIVPVSRWNRVSSGSVTSISDKRVISGYFWYGFMDQGYEESDIVRESSRETSGASNQNYAWYIVYPWQRDKIGGEGISSKIQSKILYNHLYCSCNSIYSGSINYGTALFAAIYRDFDTASILKITSLQDNNIYQGNVDYVETTDKNHAYHAWTNYASTRSESGRSYPWAYQDNSPYAGYDVDGKIIDPISLKYKTAPHIVVATSNVITGEVSPDSERLYCVELHSDNYPQITTQDLKGYQWIRCGDIAAIKSGISQSVIFEEGDYFYGRFDSLRTYRYAENDPNSVVEVVSGMLCSRVNLDSRCDRNRGNRTTFISPTNFNIFNSAYNQLNNYFNFVYVDMQDTVYQRHYKNSIQWSLTKEFSSDIDNWCNIQDINTLDLDGDKGEIKAITKLGNDIIVFQDTGICQILYNEKTQIATSEGISIEIANSGKVDGKYYLYDTIGCQYYGSVAKSPEGIFFIDSINKSIYLLQNTKQIVDLCTVNGMKSWGLANLDSNWWSYYDNNSQEVLFTNDVESLAFNVPYMKFSSFLGYGKIRWNFRIDNITIQVCPPNLQYVVSSTTRTLWDSTRIPSKIVSLVPENPQNLEDSDPRKIFLKNSFWKKNSQDATNFFRQDCPIEVQLQCNPEPTVDKMFSVLEYRMDCFNSSNIYLPDTTFTKFRAWNEYQDTLPTSLLYNQNIREGVVYNNAYTARLKKKFRIWRLDIPRATSFSTIELSGNEAQSNISTTQELEASIAQSGGTTSRDRIRNLWCNIYLSLDPEGLNVNKKPSRIVLNDLAIQYFK